MNEEDKQLLKKLIITLAIGIFLFVSVSSIYKIISAPELEEQKIAKERIKIEYANLNIPTNSRQISYSYSDTGRQIFVSLSGTFYTDRSWEEIRDFYTEEAKRSGWRFLRFEDGEKWRAIDFGKGKYTFYCTYFENKSEYTISLHWNADLKEE